jgi:AcrR family transcriptional regulator
MIEQGVRTRCHCEVCGNPLGETDPNTAETKVVRGPYQNGIRRRREIIESASRIFAAHGFNSGTLREIAKEVGVTPAALARHFDSKEGLLSAVLENWDAEAAARNPGDVRGLAHFIRIRDTVSYNQANRGLIELFLTLSGESTNPTHPARKFIQERYRRVADRNAQLLRDARDAGEVLWMDDETIAAEVRMLSAMMDGIQLQWLIDPEIDLVGIFSYALSGILERWTGRKDVLPPLAT